MQKGVANKAKHETNFKKSKSLPKFGSPASASSLRSHASSLKRRQGLLLGALDREELREAGNGENFKNLGGEIAKLELAAGRFDLLVEQDQLVERGGGEKLDAGKVEQDVVPLFLLDQGEQLVGQLLNEERIHDLA